MIVAGIVLLALGGVFVRFARSMTEWGLRIDAATWQRPAPALYRTFVLWFFRGWGAIMIGYGLYLAAAGAT